MAMPPKVSPGATITYWEPEPTGGAAEAGADSAATGFSTVLSPADSTALAGTSSAARSESLAAWGRKGAAERVVAVIESSSTTGTVSVTVTGCMAQARAWRTGARFI